MGTLHGPVICRTVVHSRNGARLLVNTSLATKGTILGSGLRGSRGKCRVVIRVGRPCERRSMSVNCSFSSSSDGNGSMAENFNESDEDYVDSSVIEAVEMPSILLMAAVCNVQIARPTVYQVVKEMIDKMGYQVKLVRVTKRVHEAYFAQLCLTKVGNEKNCISFDLRPSDAINMAARCRVPIQVNKHLAYSDGMKVLEPSKMAVHSPFSDGLLTADLDRPDGQPCLETKEFDLVRNMLIAAAEERYRDAAKWKNKLAKLRAKRRNCA